MTADFQQALEYEMTVTNYCGHILYSSWKEIKNKSTTKEGNFIQSKFCMVTASTVFIKNMLFKKKKQHMDLKNMDLEHSNSFP